MSTFQSLGSIFHYRSSYGNYSGYANNPYNQLISGDYSNPQQYAAHQNEYGSEPTPVLQVRQVKPPDTKEHMHKPKKNKEKALNKKRIIKVQTRIIFALLLMVIILSVIIILMQTRKFYINVTP
jgi:hypothetical protein